MVKLSPSALALTELVLEVFRVNGLALAAGDELARPAGLTSARWQVLGVVDHGALPAAHVARMMGLTRQSVRQVADALATDGFVEYLDNPHHRTAKCIGITTAGRRALRKVEARQAAWAKRLSEHLTLGELREAVAVLRALRQVLEEDSP